MCYSRARIQDQICLIVLASVHSHKWNLICGSARLSRMKRTSAFTASNKKKIVKTTHDVIVKVTVLPKKFHWTNTFPSPAVHTLPLHHYSGINFLPCNKGHHNRLSVIINMGQKNPWDKIFTHESRGQNRQNFQLYSMQF